MSEYPIKQIVDHHGNFVDESYKSRIDEELVKKFYIQLRRTRMFDIKARNLQRQGRINTYPGYEGQEAAQVGSALALDDKDWLFPTYRDHAAKIAFGDHLKTTFTYWTGRIDGCIPPEGKRIVPPSTPLATQLPQAVGAAFAEKYKGTNQAVIVYFGDGATSEGDFHEGLNLASVYKAPVVFFAQNNSYAISTPIWKQMNSKTIAQKAVAYDIPGIRIDGNDVFITYFETMKALQRARAGEGPTLIEAVTWRYNGHTTADDPGKYRDQSESERRREYDPVTRIERFMKNYGYWDEAWIEKVNAEIAEEIEEGVRGMESQPKPDVNDVFDLMFAEPTWTIKEQKEAYMKELRGEV